MDKREIKFEVQERNFNKILIAVDEDDSSSSQQAFNYGVTAARKYDIPLGIVTVLETGDLNIYDSLLPDVIEKWRQSMRDSVNTYVKKARDFGVTDVQGFVSEGKPGKVIVENIIPKFEPDLLVCGSETKDKSKIFIGSQASYMSQMAPCSVIVVR